MPWVEVFVAFLVSHLAGDYIAQTEFQAMNKHGGLGRDPVARRALGTHALVYLLCFAPALLWLASEVSAVTLALCAAAIVVPHVIQDDGRVIAWWMRTVKKTSDEPGLLTMAVDQSFHVVTLLLLAVVVGT